MRGALGGGLLGLLICLPFFLGGVWMIKNDAPIAGILVIVAPTIVTIIGSAYRSLATKRRERARASSRRVQEPIRMYIDERGDVWSNHPWASFSGGIREELDQTPAWWDRQFDALVKKDISRDWAHHQDHELEEPITFYAAGYEMRRRCLDCGVNIDSPR